MAAAVAMVMVLLLERSTVARSALLNQRANVDVDVEITGDAAEANVDGLEV